MKHNAILPIVVLSLLSPNIFADTNNANPNPALSKSTQKVQMDAIDIILQDHDKIREMIASIDKSLNSNITQSRSDFKELKDFLIQHETMEQKVWYPALEKHNDLQDIIAKLKKEEQEAGDELKKMDDITDDKEWASTFRQLAKDVAHHANDEETKLFPKVKKSLNKVSLDQIGEKIKDYKNQNEM